MHCTSALLLSPSFNTYSSAKFSEMATSVVQELRAKSESEQVQEKTDKEEDDFEFGFVGGKFDSSPVSADQIFYKGQIRPLFPIFNRDYWRLGDVDKPPTRAIRLPLRKLLIQDRDSSSSEADGVDGAPPGTYCVWRPKTAAEAEAEAEGWKKSGSVGTVKRGMLGDLLRRSNSERKDGLVFSNSAKKRGGKVEKARREERKAEVRAKGVGGPVEEGNPRRYFVPYREEVVGFVADVNGLNRKLHPF